MCERQHFSIGSQGQEPEEATGPVEQSGLFRFSEVFGGSAVRERWAAKAKAARVYGDLSQAVGGGWGMSFDPERLQPLRYSFIRPAHSCTELHSNTHNSSWFVQHCSITYTPHGGSECMMGMVSTSRTLKSCMGHYEIILFLFLMFVFSFMTILY